MPTFNVILFKGKDKREDVLSAKSRQDANDKAEKKYPGFIADTSLTAKIG
ncbi:hypothetical protein HNW13_017900 [Shewanella sp. BF02_Schw]|nr:hypothetical protein [Shewanella sp. BF02_Schw]MBO1897613.1 hypothetical protein [Shewanella sp. BF02_Schw]